MFKPERNVESRRFKKEKYKRKEELKECESSENEIRYSEKKRDTCQSIIVHIFIYHHYYLIQQNMLIFSILFLNSQNSQVLDIVQEVILELFHRNEILLLVQFIDTLIDLQLVCHFSLSINGISCFWVIFVSFIDLPINSFGIYVNVNLLDFACFIRIDDNHIG